MTIYERIKIVAKKEKISIRQLSKDLGIGLTTIYKWAHTTPQIEVLIKVADRLNVSIDYLVGRINSEDTNSTLAHPNKNDELIYSENSAAYIFDNTDLNPEETKQIKDTLEFAEKLARHHLKIEKKAQEIKDSYK